VNRPDSGRKCVINPTFCDARLEPLRCGADDGDDQPDLPNWLVEIIDRLLAKQPEDRFHTAAEVAEASIRELLTANIKHLKVFQTRETLNGAVAHTGCPNRAVGER
jgi:hypothetical protein